MFLATMQTESCVTSVYVYANTDSIYDKTEELT